MRFSLKSKTIFNSALVLLGAGVASPMLTAYWLDDMVIILTDPDKKLIGIGILNTVTCISNKVSPLVN